MLSLNITELNLLPLLDEIIQLMKLKLNNKNIELSFQIENENKNVILKTCP